MMKIEMVKLNFFYSLHFNEFIKLNVSHFCLLKLNDAFQLRVIDKIKFFTLIKPILATKIKLSKKIKKSQPHEIIIHEQNNEQLKNIDDHDINNRIHLHDSITHYYQKKEDVNFVLTNEQKFMSPFFRKEFMNI